MSDRWLKGVTYSNNLSPKDIEIKEKDKEIERLNNIITKLDLYVRNEILKFAGFMTIEEYVNYFKKLKEVEMPRKGEVVSLEELESYEPKNSIEEEYYDEMWS